MFQAFDSLSDHIANNSCQEHSNGESHPHNHKADLKPDIVEKEVKWGREASRSKRHEEERITSDLSHNRLVHYGGEQLNCFLRRGVHKRCELEI